jgi:hypothetical protein
VSAKRGISASKLHDDILALDEQAGYCYSLNASAARVWELIATPISLDELCQILSREFIVDKELCLQDVSELLSSMNESGMITVRDGQSG